MSKKHPNADEPTILQAVHDRTLAMMAAIAHHPGLTFEELRDDLEEATGTRWSPATLYQDLKRIKAAGLLADVRHRKGYFLVGPTFSHEDMRVMMNGLRIQAHDLQNPLAKELYLQHEQRFARTREDQAYFGYPVEALANRPVVRATSDAFAQVMEALREPILRGQKVRVRLVRDNWKAKGPRDHVVYPLQFVFHDVAWYLLCEHAEKHTFFTLRLDRLSPVVEPIGRSARGALAQNERLAVAKDLLSQSWGFIFPPHDAQGNLLVERVTAKVRFGADKAAFIEEANQRHRTQEIKPRADKSVIFQVTLPDQATIWLFFKAWVASWGASAEILEPEWLRREMGEELARSAAAYQTNEATSQVPQAPAKGKQALSTT